ncbi:MAG: hypothetical protein HON53_03890 [Planctomycetaceae bacterium]|jgi:hypothetical protein|nr:hypothetical protein [Planctomycetaceae bacterium]MBT6154157.1 hypothetical protein [Planctomycetaceae bacterium]MBT6487846.1 hypothetical protein [Planctomycetaceae bacterium]MBT6495692.1 hypothetical protein [Planctomycetaceae bacterium]
MTINRSQSLLLIGFAALMCGPGCVYRSPLSTYRVWADGNTLGTPAMFIEETDHLPYHAPRVERYRWMYNLDTVAQRHNGGVYTAAAFVPSKPIPSNQQPSIPAPSELPTDNPITPEMQIPPLPSKLPRQLKSIDDAPGPATPIPQSPPPKRKEFVGPTALDYGLIFPPHF